MLPSIRAESTRSTNIHDPTAPAQSLSLFTFGITENVQNINNTPDIGFQFGFAYVPHPVQAR